MREPQRPSGAEVNRQRRVSGLDLGCLPAVTEALAARAQQHDREASFPDDGIAAVHAAGLLTATVAERYGGPGAGLAQTVAILRALGRGDPSAALITAMTLFAHALQAQQPKRQRAQQAQSQGRRKRPSLLRPSR